MPVRTSSEAPREKLSPRARRREAYDSAREAAFFVMQHKDKEKDDLHQKELDADVEDHKKKSDAAAKPKTGEPEQRRESRSLKSRKSAVERIMRPYVTDESHLLLASILLPILAAVVGVFYLMWARRNSVLLSVNGASSVADQIAEILGQEEKEEHGRWSADTEILPPIAPQDEFR